MKYRNKKTNDIFIHLAHAVNLDEVSTTPVIVFCPDDSEHSIFTMSAEKFSREFEVICHACGNVGPEQGELLEYCTSCALDKMMKNAA